MKTKLISLAGAALLGASMLAVSPAAAAPLSPAPLGNAVDQVGTGIEQAYHRRHRRWHRHRHHYWAPFPFFYPHCYHTRRGRLICY